MISRISAKIKPTIFKHLKTGYLPTPPWQRGARSLTTDSEGELIPVLKTPEDESQELMFNCGVHLGHANSSMNQFMKGYMYGHRHGRAIFDLRKTFQLLQRSTRFLNNVYENNGRIIIVGTRPDIAKLIHPLIPHNPLINFVGHKWVGGTITNWGELMDYAQKLCKGAWENFDEAKYQECKQRGDKIEKEMTYLLISHLNKQLSEPRHKRFLRNFSVFIEVLRWNHLMEIARDKIKFENNGKITLPEILDLEERPSCVLMLHASDSEIAMTEAYQHGVPAIGICDSDCDPRMIQYIIPGNDDSLKAQYLYTRTLLHSIPSFII